MQTNVSNCVPAMALLLMQ